MCRSVEGEPCLLDSFFYAGLDFVDSGCLPGEYYAGYTCPVALNDDGSVADWSACQENTCKRIDSKLMNSRNSKEMT